MKAPFKKKLTDYDMQQLIGQVLRTGVFLSGTITSIGGIWYLFQEGAGIPHYGTFVGEPAGFTSLTGIYRGLLEGSAAETIQLGVVILIATPIIRIIFSLFSFILEKDRLYIIITLIVLCVIMGSMFGGLKG